LTTLVYLDGRFQAPEEAVVPLLGGYLLGEGVFATMRGYDGVCFRPGAHLAELERGAAMFGFEVPESPVELAALADAIAARTGERNAYVRVTVTRGAPHGGEGRATLSLIARAMDVPPDAAYATGIDAITVSARRIPPACADGTIKTTSYGPQVVARREVTAQGAAEGIQLTVDGALACGTMSNLFLVRGDELVTPSLASGCRAGVTRAAVLEVGRELGLAVHERRLEPQELWSADEAFFASTRIECLPIATVDGRRVGGSFGRTHALREAFAALVARDTADRRRGAA
jgi:branched-subunit amino acid aminotransferase/4-amino-4-deoxychorismate lyase